MKPFTFLSATHSWAKGRVGRQGVRLWKAWERQQGEASLPSSGQSVKVVKVEELSPSVMLDIPEARDRGWWLVGN